MCRLLADVENTIDELTVDQLNVLTARITRNVTKFIHRKNNNSQYQESFKNTKNFLKEHAEV